MISGTRLNTIRAPLMAPRIRPSSSTMTTTAAPKASLSPAINRAAVTLVRAIMAATERSMPPPITTTVCAATAKA
jgi:hypothetical protein